jgi:glycosyltransferase involved in cell wall biosynthesis
VTRVTIVFPNPRSQVIADARAGMAPDTTLLAANELPEHGLEVRVRDSFLDTRATFVPKRARWHLRELTLPWEAGATDVMFTPLANLIPFTARARRIPLVVFNFGLNTILRRGPRPRTAALAASLRQATLVLSLAASQREELLELAGIEAHRARVVLHGVDHRFFTPQEEVPRERLVLAVGRDLARDYPTFLDAVRDVDARVVIVAVRNRNLAGLELPPNVEVREHIPWTELRDLYGRAGCVAIPLRAAGYAYGSEASGITALLEAEAMAAPIVATGRPVLRDYLTHGDNALLVTEENPDALSAALRSLLDDAELARALGRAGRRRVAARHTMDDMAAELAPLLEEAAAVRRAR